MSDISSNNKRIAKNTFLLYARMMFIMCIQLYTSRVVLEILGVIDFGLYNVVGGIVAMFTFLNSSMATSTQRYITFNIGKGDTAAIKSAFSTSIQIHMLISFVVLLLAETVGVWFFYNKMQIPANRVDVAFWVYQISILTTIINIMSVPYNADIIAHEKMSVFAYISLLEVILKLVLVYFLYLFSYDKLMLYAILLLLIQMLIRFIYSQYCTRHYEEAHLMWRWNKSEFLEMTSFAGWNLWGNISGTLFSQGLNLLLNMFFGPAVNAARAVAVQVERSILQFSSSFLVAVNPQITKMYAQGKLVDMHSLLFRASKFAFMLLFILSLPVVLEIDMILSVWLKSTPEWTGIFVIIILFTAIIDAVARPFMVAATATGDVKLYQSVVGGILIAIVPISYVVLKLGGNPVSVFLVHLLVAAFAFVVRLYIVSNMIGFKPSSYCIHTLLPIVKVMLVGVPIPLVLSVVLPDGMWYSFAVIVLSVINAMLAVFFVGLTVNERRFFESKMIIVRQKIIKCFR